ncbi:MAG: 3-isopropylmalate dehydrogenase [Holophagales bacterium]|nr:3-isopropylmalate dehydrogenase [Holophagales bacterium]MYF05740.1 3-isopropylmalate dehydrogenase [Holophagales bacterium]
MQANIVLLPGDGVGPEVTTEATRVLNAVAELGGHGFQLDAHPMGGNAIDDFGNPLPPATLAACKAADAVLLGAVGGPKWSDPTAELRPEQGLLDLRAEMGLFANLRPVPVFESLAPFAPLKPELLRGVDLLFVRELTGGIYFGPRQEQGDGDVAHDTLVYSTAEVERVARVALRAARGRRGKVASIDKANVLASMRLWRRSVTEVASAYPDVEVTHHLVDAFAMQLMRSPADYDVILAGNMFGDILSDEAAILAGSLGMLPSASLGSGRQGLYEPVHGSAPDIAGRGIANPVGAILSAAMLLRHSLDLEAEAARVEASVAAVLEDGLRTADLASTGQASVSTTEMGKAIAAGIRGA